MKIERIGDWTLEDRLASGGGPLVVLFVTSGYRRRDVPREEFARLATLYTEARFCVVDLLENPSLAERFSISEAPTTLVFVDGREATRHVGSLLLQPVARILGPHRRPHPRGLKEGGFE